MVAVRVLQVSSRSQRLSIEDLLLARKFILLSDEVGGCHSSGGRYPSIVEGLVLRVVGRLSSGRLDHRVDVIVSHFEVRLGEGLPLGAWRLVARVGKHVFRGLCFLVAPGEDSLFALLLSLGNVALVGIWEVAPLNNLLHGLLGLDLVRLFTEGVRPFLIHNFL